MAHKVTGKQAQLVGNILNVRWDKVDFDEFKRGLEIELEHGTDFAETDVTKNDLVKVGKIALAHLRELPDYYSRLKKMEKKGKKELGLSENSNSGPSPVNANMFSDKLIDRIAEALNLDLSKIQIDEYRLGVIRELEKMQVYTTAGLNNEKLAKAALNSYENILNEPAFYSNPPNQEFSHPLALDRQKFVTPGVEMFAKESVREYVDLMITEDFASALKKLKSAPENIWNAAKAKFQKATGVFNRLLNSSLNNLTNGKTKLKPWADLLIQSQNETGEKLPIDDVMKIAMGLPALAKQAEAEISQQKQAIPKPAAQQTPQQAQTPPADAPAAAPAATATESSNHLMKDMTMILEASIDDYRKTEVRKENAVLTEVLTPTVVLGFILAIVGGIPMLLNGLIKLSTKFGLTKTTTMLKHAHHVAHKIESKVVDYVIPDRISFKIYEKMWNKGFKIVQKDNILTYEEYTAGARGARSRTEALVYKLLLTIFFVNGVAGAIKAGISFMGLAEGAASSVKAVEIATAVGQAAEIIIPAYAISQGDL